jgi:uncharacterized damage-inducible protein DinB
MLFEKAFNTLQADTEKVWQQFANYDAQTLNLSQAPGKWSAIQHMVHLNKSERSFVILLTKALRNNAPLNGSVLKVNFMSRLYKVYLNFGRKIKAPKVIEPAQEFFEVEQVKKDFEKTRAQLFPLLQSLTKEQIPKFWVHHLYLKELRVGDLIDFMVFHQNHHRRLFGRYLKKN